jgi:hypothetical protein
MRDFNENSPRGHIIAPGNLRLRLEESCLTDQASRVNSRSPISTRLNGGARGAGRSPGLESAAILPTLMPRPAVRADGKGLRRRETLCCIRELFAPYSRKSSALLPSAGCGCSSGVEHNLAKVGVEGSNPFARSKFLQGNEAVKTVLRGRFCFPAATRKWGKQGEAAVKRKAAGYRLSPAWGASQSHGFPSARRAAMGDAAPHREG